MKSTANSFNARIESSFSSIGGLGARPWELMPGSAADQAALNAFALDPEAISGFFLVDDSGHDHRRCPASARGHSASTYRPSDWAQIKTVAGVGAGRGASGDGRRR